MNEPIKEFQTPLIQFKVQLLLKYQKRIYYAFHLRDEEEARFMAKRWARDKEHTFRIVETDMVQRKDWLTTVTFKSGDRTRICYAEYPRLAVLWREWFEHPYLPFGHKPPTRRWTVTYKSQVRWEDFGPF